MTTPKDLITLYILEAAMLAIPELLEVLEAALRFDVPHAERFTDQNIALLLDAARKAVAKLEVE